MKKLELEQQRIERVAMNLMVKYQRMEAQRNKKKLIVRNKSQGQLGNPAWKKRKSEDEEQKGEKGIEQRFREWATGLRKYEPNEKLRSSSNGSQRKFSADRPQISNLAELYPIHRKPLEIIREPINLGSSPLSSNS